MTFVATLEPTALWGHFDAILTIPRGSKNEGEMRRHVARVARRTGLVHEVDAAGNIVVRKPGTAGCESAPITILQGHLDMVNEKNTDVEHDFTKDPFIPRMDGGYVTASGTTLGSDNGIGVATMLAVIEATNVVHGPLEFLFTIDEETGLTGATQLDSDLLEGRQLINLDSEEEGVLYVGVRRWRRHPADRRARHHPNGRGRHPSHHCPNGAEGGTLGLRHPPAAWQRRRPAGSRPLECVRVHGLPAGAIRGRERTQRHPSGGVRHGRREPRGARRRRRRDRPRVRVDTGRVPSSRSGDATGSR